MSSVKISLITLAGYSMSFSQQCKNEFEGSSLICSSNIILAIFKAGLTANPLDKSSCFDFSLIESVLEVKEKYFGFSNSI